MAVWPKSRSSASSAGAAGRPLACPRCGSAFAEPVRFCPDCRLPLVRVVGEVRAGEASERARKIDPRYARGELVRVAGGRNQAEAELIQNLLLEEGVPSILRRSAGFDVPDFLAAGPRDVLVPADGVDAARQTLLDTGLAPGAAAGRARPAAWRLAAAVLGGGLLTALVAWALARAASG